MATIFEKIPASGEKCLILNPRESLYYPFNFETGWREVRMGVFLSFVSATGDNSAQINETITNSTFNANNNLFFGLTNNPNNDFPYINTGIFIGLGSHTGNNVQITTAGAINNVSRFGVLFGNSFSGSVSARNGDYINIPTNTNTVGTGSYMKFYGTQIKINPTLKTFEVLNSNNSNGVISNASTVSLRQTLNLFAGAIPATPSTGYYTDNFASNGNLLSYPNKIFMYFPFFNNRIRIHNLIIEKYS